MENIEIKYTPDRVGYCRDIPQIRKKWTPKNVQGAILFPQIMVIIVAAGIGACLGLLSNITRIPSLYISIGYMGVIVAIYILYRRWIVSWLLGLMAKRINEIEAPRVTSLVADQNGISAVDRASRLELFWSGILAVDEFRHGVGVITSNLVLHIPNAAFADNAQRERLLTFAKEQLALQPKA